MVQKRVGGKQKKSDGMVRGVCRSSNDGVGEEWRKLLPDSGIVEGRQVGVFLWWTFKGGGWFVTQWIGLEEGWSQGRY